MSPDKRAPKAHTFNFCLPLIGDTGGADESSGTPTEAEKTHLPWRLVRFATDQRCIPEIGGSDERRSRVIVKSVLR